MPDWSGLDFGDEMKRSSGIIAVVLDYLNKELRKRAASQEMSTGVKPST